MSAGTVCAVLKSGGEFGPEHAEYLRKQVAAKMPNWKWKLWTDFPDIADSVRLRHNFPKWWGKYEIYDANIGEPIFVLDLDMVIRKEWVPAKEHVDKAVVVRDPMNSIHYGNEIFLGGMLYLPPHAQQRMAAKFFDNPERHIAWHAGNDQPIIREALGKDRKEVIRANDYYIDGFVSYKYQVKYTGLSPDNYLVYFHGLPRPWDVQEDWIPSL